MERIRLYFDRHTKQRVALQLAVDALPLLLMIGFGMCMYNLFSYRLELEWLMHIGVFGFLLLPLPLFILGIWMRGAAEGAFACYAWCAKVSTGLRIAGALAVSIALVLDLFFLAALISL